MQNVRKNPYAAQSTYKKSSPKRFQKVKSQVKSQVNHQKKNVLHFCTVKSQLVRGLAKSALTLGLETFKIAWVRFLRLEAIYFSFKYKHKL